MNATSPKDRIAYAKRTGQRFAEDVEYWKKEYESAQHCLDVEDLVSDFTRFFDRILDIDTGVRERYAGGMSYDPELDRELSGLMTLWVRIARLLSVLVGRLRADGYGVEGAEELRVKLVEGEAIIGAEIAGGRFPEALVALRDQAVTEDRDGLTVPGLVDDEPPTAHPG